NSSARRLKSGASPFCTLKNAIELPTPLSAVLNVVFTNGKRSFRQPLGLCRVAFATLQSDCCHIWKKRWIVSPVYASSDIVGPVSWNGPFGRCAALVTRVSTLFLGRLVAPVVSKAKSAVSRSRSMAATCSDLNGGGAVSLGTVDAPSVSGGGSVA